MSMIGIGIFNYFLEITKLLLENGAEPTAWIATTHTALSYTLRSCC